MVAFLFRRSFHASPLINSQPGRACLSHTCVRGSSAASQNFRWKCVRGSVHVRSSLSTAGMSLRFLCAAWGSTHSSRRAVGPPSPSRTSASRWSRSSSTTIWAEAAEVQTLWSRHPATPGLQQLQGFAGASTFRSSACIRMAGSLMCKSCRRAFLGHLTVLQPIGLRARLPSRLQSQRCFRKLADDHGRRT